MAIKWEKVQFGFNPKTGDIFLGECEKTKNGKMQWRRGKSQDVTAEIAQALAQKMKFTLKKRNAEREKGVPLIKYYGWKLPDGAQLVYIPNGYDFAVAKIISTKK